MNVFKKRKLYGQVTEIPAKIIGKGLHKNFKDVVNELNNALPNLGELGS